MIITKHGVMRFKQRQKIKNSNEMKHKVYCAIKRGKLQKNIAYSPDTKCYLFDGYLFVSALPNKKQLLINKDTICWLIRLNSVAV